MNTRKKIVKYSNVAPPRPIAPKSQSMPAAVTMPEAATKPPTPAVVTKPRKSTAVASASTSTTATATSTAAAAAPRKQKNTPLPPPQPQHAEEWERNFQLLEKFHSQHGHCKVPADDPLGEWCMRQRINRVTLSVSQRERLYALGFNWEMNAHDRFDYMFAKLQNYKNLYGDCLVPARYKADPKLGKWVSRQRETKNTLRENRIAKLDALGFCWRVDSWQKTKLKQEQRHQPVRRCDNFVITDYPQVETPPPPLVLSPQDKELSQRLEAVKNFGKERGWNHLPPELQQWFECPKGRRNELLLRTGYKRKLVKALEELEDRRWNNQLGDIRQQAKNPNFVEAKDLSPSLRDWLQQQKKQKLLLKDHQKQKLEELLAELSGLAWSRRLEKVRSMVFDHLPRELREWLEQQKRQKLLLKPSQKRQLEGVLEEIAYCDDWRQQMQRVEYLGERYGWYYSSMSKLSRKWLEQQVQNMDALTPTQREKLETVRRKMDAVERQWHEQMEQVALLSGRDGLNNLPHSLRDWYLRQNNLVLSPTQKQHLETVRKAIERKVWKDRLQQLHEFAQALPVTSTPMDPELKMWLDCQVNQLGILSPEDRKEISDIVVKCKAATGSSDFQELNQTTRAGTKYTLSGVSGAPQAPNQQAAKPVLIFLSPLMARPHNQTRLIEPSKTQVVPLQLPQRPTTYHQATVQPANSSSITPKTNNCHPMSTQSGPPQPDPTAATTITTTTKGQKLAPRSTISSRLSSKGMEIIPYQELSPQPNMDATPMPTPGNILRSVETPEPTISFDHTPRAVITPLADPTELLLLQEEELGASPGKLETELQSATHWKENGRPENNRKIRFSELPTNLKKKKRRQRDEEALSFAAACSKKLKLRQRSNGTSKMEV